MRRPRWRTVWSARRIWWSTPFPLSRGASASMMRQRGTRPQKSPPAHRRDNGSVRHPGHSLAGASAATAARAPKDDAPLRPSVPGDGQRVGDAGPPDGETMAGIILNDPATTEIYTLSLHDALHHLAPV